MSNEFDNINSMSDQLIQCSLCQRRMRQDVYLKHPNVCLKNPSNKRNVQVFDMTKYRSVQSGDKIIPVCKISPNNTNNNSSIVRPSQTRSAKRDRRSDLIVQPIIENFCCPTCKRTFCEKAYDRHVSFCTSKIKQIQQPPSEQVLLARLKLDRRVKFGTNRIIPSTSTKSSPPIIHTEPIIVKSNIRLSPLVSLAHCPWCSKPYLPKCTHYCRNIQDQLFPIHSK